MRLIQKRLKYALLAPAFIVATFAMQFANVSFVSAATVTWDGEGTDTNFSTPENWVGDAAPIANDVLVFPANAGTDTTLVNDLGISFGDVTVNGGAGSAGSYSLNTLSLITGAELTVSGTDTQVDITALNAAGDVTLDGNGKLDITTLDVTGNLTSISSLTTSIAGVDGNVTSSAAFTGASLTVGGNLASTAAFTVPTVAVTGNATFSSAVPTITTLSAADLTSNVALAVTTLSLTGDFLAASAGSLNVSGTFSVPSNYTVAKTFTAGTFSVGGNLTVTVAPTVTTLNVTGNLTNNATLSVTDLNISGTLQSASTGNLTVTDTFAAPADYSVDEGFTADTFDVGGNLTVGTSFTATTTGVTGNLTGTSNFNAGDLTVGGNLTTTTFTATSTDVTGDLSVSSSTSNAGDATVGGDLTVGTGSTLATNSVALTGDLNVAGTLTATTDVDVTGSLATYTGTINVTGTLTIDDDLTLARSLTAGVLHVTGNAIFSSTLSSTDIVVDGDLQVNAYLSTAAKYTIGGDVNVGDYANSSFSRWITLADGTDITGDVTISRTSNLQQSDNATISIGKLIVENGATARLNGVLDFPVEFGSGKSDALPALTYNTNYYYDADLDEYLYPTLKFTGDTTLKNNLRVHIYGDQTTGTMEFEGDITYNGFKISKSSSSIGKLIISGKEVKNAVVTNEYNGERYDQSESIAENETGILTGKRSSVTVYPGGVLKGTGTALSVSLYFNATLSPGNSPGTMTIPTSLNMAEDSIFYVELKSTSAYDKVVVGEDYTSTGNAVNVTDATLDVVLYEGYSIKKGDKFTIIDNKSDTDILGVFSGYPEGATMNLGGGTFTITYVGGDGNDVVLTVTKAPTAIVGVPNTGILRLIKANPAVSAIIGLTTAGMLFLLARRQLAMQRR